MCIVKSLMWGFPILVYENTICQKLTCADLKSHQYNQMKLNPVEIIVL